MSELYKARFPIGSTVRIIQKDVLEAFARDWRYHHKLQAEQMEYAGVTTMVKDVSFYHGGDQLYVLENVPGIWNEPCLEAVP